MHTGGVNTQVRRGEISIGRLGAVFGAIVLVSNLAVAGIVFPLLPTSINRFAFLMLLVETGAWTYHFALNTSFRNWVLGLANNVRNERG